MSALYPEGVTPVVFECDLDRDQAAIPSPYMPSVSGVLVAGKDMLIAAGDISGAPAPVGWGPTGPAIPEADCFSQHRMADFEKLSRDGKYVLRAKRFGKFWAPERSTLITSGRYRFRSIEALVFAFGEIPIWTRTSQAAMRLAEHCHPLPAPPVAGFWRPMLVTS
jgi:hypothetical protein